MATGSFGLERTSVCFVDWPCEYRITTRCDIDEVCRVAGILAGIVSAEERRLVSGRSKQSETLSHWVRMEDVAMEGNGDG